MRALARFLIAVFPANIYMATAPVQFGGFLDHPLYHWLRLPFQGVLIAWLLWCAKRNSAQVPSVAVK